MSTPRPVPSLPLAASIASNVLAVDVHPAVPDSPPDFGVFSEHPRSDVLLRVACKFRCFSKIYPSPSRVSGVVKVKHRLGSPHSLADLWETPQESAVSV
jgi:hypothetical protein